MDPAQEQYDFIFSLIKNKSGIALNNDKKYLVNSRLWPIVRKRNFNNLAELFDDVKEKFNPDLINEIIDAITTNETSFFRDINFFKHLNEIIMPQIFEMAPDKKDILIWSSACSTGQEPYSLAINIKENFSHLNKNFKIIASDISDNALEKAKSGIFSQFEVQRGLPITLLLKYFIQVEREWHIKDEIKNMVNFKKINLLDNLWEVNKFDLIVCKNVLIYFDETTKKNVLSKLIHKLEEYGVLMLGPSERGYVNENNLRLLRDDVCSIYILDK